MGRQSLAIRTNLGLVTLETPEKDLDSCVFKLGLAGENNFLRV